jgi:hypothetical protein
MFTRVCHAFPSYFFMTHFNIICPSELNCRTISMAKSNVATNVHKVTLWWTQMFLFFHENFNFKAVLCKIPLNMAVSWHLLICIIGNPTSTSYKLISGEKETPVRENVELLPSTVFVNELLDKLSKNMNRKDITHKHNITVKSQTVHTVTLPKDNSKGLSHILFTLCLSLSYCSPL